MTSNASRLGELSRAIPVAKVAVVSAISVGVVALSVSLRRWLWRVRRSAAKRGAPTASVVGGDPLRMGFSEKKLPPEIDHIIVGSGLSGLYLGCLLARVGRRVLVLEQHYVAGGCTHTFKDKGFEFDTGVHYVGGATPFTAFMDFAAGRQGAFKMQRQGEEDGSQVYNEVHFGPGNMHRFRPGNQTFVKDLVAKYPQEECAIKHFMKSAAFAGPSMMILMVKQFLPQWAWHPLLRLPTPLRWIADRYIRRTLSVAMDDSGLQNAFLRATLAAEFGDHGLVPDKAPFMIHAGILTHYTEEGGFSAVGGSDAYASTLVPPILEAGGAVLVRAPVRRIVVQGGRAIGVELEGKNGLIVRARCSVISSAGVEVTYRKLLDQELVEKIGGPPQSLLATERRGIAHHIYGFVGFEGSARELKLPTYNIWSFPPAPGASGTSSDSGSDLAASWKQLYGAGPDELPAFLASDEAAREAQLPAFISFPSAKDASYDTRCPGKSCAVVLTDSNASYFGEPGPTSKRGEQYETIKKRYRYAILNALDRHFPGLASKASYVDVGTPHSNLHYLGRAGSYGLDQDASRFLDPSIRVAVPKVRGLFLTGQDVMICGVFPQVLAAWLTFAKVMGVTSPDLWLSLADFVLAVGRRCSFDKTYAPANP